MITGDICDQQDGNAPSRERKIREPSLISQYEVKEDINFRGLSTLAESFGCLLKFGMTS